MQCYKTRRQQPCLWVKMGRIGCEVMKYGNEDCTVAQPFSSEMGAAPAFIVIPVPFSFVLLR